MPSAVPIFLKSQMRNKLFILHGLTSRFSERPYIGNEGMFHEILCERVGI